ncbi:MAG: hypothetical protein KA795_05985 [Burkholderiaceae bacterium]|nr:hypothetical protein [Burkholderiaceae bacterium]
MSQIDLLGELERNGDLAMLVASPPITIHRVFAELTGSALAGLLLTCILQEYETRESVLTDGGVALSAEQLVARGGLSKAEQAMAIKTLREMKLITQSRTAGGVTYFKVDFERLTRRILQSAASSSTCSDIAARAH